MAAANESQGLKIAVAIFMTLTVMLLVTTYFAYSSYSEASAKLAEAESKANQSEQKARSATDDFNFIRIKAGYPKAEDRASLEAAIAKDEAQLKDQLTSINNKIKQMVEEYRSSGGTAEKVNELGQAADQTIAQVLNEPNRTYQSTIFRMLELLDNIGQLNTAVILDNESLRRSLASVDQTNAQQLQVQIEELRKAKDDLAAEHQRHEEERQALLRKNDELQTRTTEQATEITRLTNEMEQMKQINDTRLKDLLARLRELREQVERSEIVMDVPDGQIQYVDYERGEVRTNVTRAMGARERMELSVFDRNSPGLPTDRPKGVIQLIRVGDRDSVGKIVRTMRPSDPIRSGDHVYSAAWSPGEPKTFALIGKIDIDRDGADDREDLKRMIEAAGGRVVYDLPPPGTGRESGQLTASTSWYIIDDRQPLRPPSRSDAAPTAMEREFLERQSQILQEARLSGVRPMSVGNLLSYLGYKYGTPVPGRVEAIDRKAAEELLNPTGVPTNPPAPPAGDEAPLDDFTTQPMP